jgi:hypothetical protein
MKFKFLQLLDDLVKHIFTKFRGIWICTLGVMDLSLKGTESVRNVTIIELVNSHFN